MTPKRGSIGFNCAAADVFGCYSIVMLLAVSLRRGRTHLELALCLKESPNSVTGGPYRMQIACKRQWNI